VINKNGNYPLVEIRWMSLDAMAVVANTTRLGVGVQNPTEMIDAIGNFKASSNVYALNSISIAHSNPTETLDAI
jgi:hypothetical protein